MDSFNVQRRSCQAILLIVLICWLLCVIQINSSAIPPKRQISLGRRMLGTVKSVEGLGPLKTLTNERADHLLATGQGPGKIANLDAHMKSIVQDGEDQKNFRVWLDNRNMGYNVKITDQSSYAESDFLEHFWAWRTEKGRPLSPKEIKNSLEKYPFMRMGREVNLEPYIPPNSYLRTTQMTPGEFIKRYLPGDNRHRYWFGDEIRRQFLDSAAYWTSDLFTRYEKFALKEVEKQGYMSRSDFIDEYLPDIYGVRNEFNHYLDRMQGTSNAQGLLPAKAYMGAYFDWAREEQIWRPSDTKRFFDFRFGEPRFEKAFIKHLYKKASKSGLTKNQAYFKGEIQWEYSIFLQERNRANFFKRILYKFKDWIHRFKRSFSRLSGWDKFFLGAVTADVALHIAR